MPQDSSSPTNPGKTLVIGVGNVLKGDDGLGVQVAEILSKQKLPPNARIEEVGTPGIDLINQFEGWRKVILIDAVRMGEKPGTWKRFTPQDVEFSTNGEAFSLHETDLASVLEIAGGLNLLPEELVIYGVEPQDLSLMEGLSPPVEAIINYVAEQILSEIWK